MHFRTAWSDYFSGSYSKNCSSQLYTGRQTPSGTAVYIYDCLFRSTTSASAGGALYFSSSTQYLLVESTSFFSCRTSSHSGAIHFDNSNNGQCVLYGLCFNDCCTTSNNNPQVVFIVVNNSAMSKSFVNYSSITRCVNEISSSYYTLYHRYGKICCPSINISMNKIDCRTGFYCNPFSDMNSVTCSLTFSSFADNIATAYTCIYFSNSGAKYEIKSCNILRNTQRSSSEGTICTYGNVMIEDSCILENTATYIFHAASYSITLSKCTIDSTSKTGSVITQNTVTKSFVLALNHMSTRNCHSEYDSAGYLTPNTQTSSSSKKQKIYYSCQRLLYHHPQTNLILFTYVSFILKLLPH
jgi:hypothetical protein